MDRIQPLESRLNNGSGKSHFLSRFWHYTCIFLMTAALTALLSIHRGLPPDWLVVSGTAVFSFTALLFLSKHLRIRPAGPIARDKSEHLIWVISLVMIGGVQLVFRAIGSNDQPTVFLAIAPLIAGSLVLAAILGPSLALMTIASVVMLLGITNTTSLPVLATAWMGGIVAAYLVTPLRSRADMMRAITILVPVLAVLAASSAMTLSRGWMYVGDAAIWSTIGGVIAFSVFWFGTLMVERFMRVTTDLSLVELCSPDHPLIKELCLRAPGTYAHSVMVGNLAEAAARAIDANPVICRAMAIFHDIGKVNRPSCFIENQMGRNIHDELDPVYSAQLVISHVSEGVELAKKHKLPQVIVDGIEQHHGTSLIAPFYHRAQNMSPELATAPDFEAKFRYPGPKPLSKEAAILHLADMAEAASRSLQPGQDAMALIRSIIDKTQKDGQLDESDLTFHDLEAIRDSFALVLGALRHERISYPGQEGQLASHPSDQSVEQIL